MLGFIAMQSQSKLKFTGKNDSGLGVVSTSRSLIICPHEKAVDSRNSTETAKALGSFWALTLTESFVNIYNANWGKPYRQSAASIVAMDRWLIFDRDVLRISDRNPIKILFSPCFWDRMVFFGRMSVQ